LNIRIIPSLLLKDGGLVKSVKFRDYKYVGDPINAVRIFNDKEADELVFLDIGAGAKGEGPDFDLLYDIASEAFMPFGYGGGIRNMEDVRRLFALGVEKIILNTIAFEQPNLIAEAAKFAGCSGVVVSIDVGRNLFGRYAVVTNSGRKRRSSDPSVYAKRCEELGAGEILLNSIPRDGTMTGYDLEMIKKLSEAVSIPVVALGGAGKMNDFVEAVEAGASAVAAGSMFVFHGKHRAVLITYPTYGELEGMLS